MRRPLPQASKGEWIAYADSLEAKMPATPLTSGCGLSRMVTSNPKEVQVNDQARSIITMHSGDKFFVTEHQAKAAGLVNAARTRGELVTLTRWTASAVTLLSLDAAKVERVEVNA